MLTSGQVALVRDWISDVEPPTDVQLDPIMTRTGSLKGVVEAVLRKRLATLQAEPAQFNVPGDYSQTNAENIRSLERQLKLLDSHDDDLKVITTESGTATAGPIKVLRLSRRGARR